MVIYHMKQVLRQRFARIELGDEKNMFRRVLVFIRDSALVVAQHRHTTKVHIRGFEDSEFIECWHAAEAGHVVEQGFAVFDRP